MGESIFLYIYIMPMHVLVFHEKGFSKKCVLVFHLFFFNYSYSSVLCSINCFIHFKSQVLKWHHAPHPVSDPMYPCVA